MEGVWELSDPSIFEMQVVGNRMAGEFQVTNGYGPKVATQVMRVHYKLIVCDSSSMSTNEIIYSEYFNTL